MNWVVAKCCLQKKICLAILSIAATFASFDSTASAQVTSFSFESAAGTWAGRGWDVNISPDDDWSFAFSKTFTTGATFTMTNNDPLAAPNVFPGEDWEMVFEGPDGALLTPGLYTASRFPFNDPGVAGIEFGGNGRVNNNLDGTFQVFEAIYDAGDNLTAFSADFNVIEETNPDRWINGSIRFNATSVPEPSSAFILALCSTAMIIRRRK